MVIVEGTKIHAIYLEECAGATIGITPTITIKVHPSEGGTVRMEIIDRKHMDNRLDAAYNEFMEELFGTVPTQPAQEFVDREKYREVMIKVQKRYGLEQGDPDFLEWVLTLVGRSPQLVDAGEGDDADARSTEEPAEHAMGEAPPSQAE